MGGERNKMIDKAKEKRGYYFQNREKILARLQEKRDNMTDEERKDLNRRSRTSQYKFHKNNPEARKNYHFKFKYGLARKDIKRLWEQQSRKCLICRTILIFGSSGEKNACVDHSHKTGKIRGILCSACNTGIGLFKESPKLLKRAIGYLS